MGKWESLLTALTEAITEKDIQISLEELVTETIEGTPGNDLTITAPDGQDIILIMGDDGGAKKVSFKADDGTEIGSINSLGVLTADEFVGDLTGEVTGDVEGEVTTGVINADGNLNITADTDSDVIIKLSDNAGAKKLLIKDSENAGVVEVDSNGGIDAVAVEANLTGNVTGNITADTSSDLEITAEAGEDILVTLGDEGGSQKLSILDNNSVEVASIDSNGNLAVNEATADKFTGNLEGDGQLEIDADSDENIIIKLGDDDGTNSLNIDDSASGTVASLDSEGNLLVQGNLTAVNGVVLNPVNSAGITIEALTAALGDPNEIENGTTFQIRDTADANKIYLVTIYGASFMISQEYTAAESE